MPRSLRIVQLMLVTALVLSLTRPAAAQDSGEEAFIAGLLPRMSPEAKIGQLFIVTFSGTNASTDSDVADLILNYHVGGVQLSIAAGNIINDADTPAQVAGLTTALQNLSRQAARSIGASPFVPLLIAVQQDGDGAPHSQISAGLTPAPSYLALGATWSQAEAEDAGRLVGQELSALGINLLLGPSLDVRLQPTTSELDPGVNVFGGDPYWVGALAQAYVRGLRAGSNDQLAAVLNHFPGQGSLDDASYTIDRSLDDLLKVDLPPFFSLLQPPIGTPRPLADALLTTNVRYRGFAGNIRERTRPISIDATVLPTLLDQPEVKAWRDAGGLVIGDVFGDPVVRDFYAATASGTFSVTQAALEAFQAGNDVLVLRDLSPEVVENGRLVREVIDAFTQKYSTDPAFQARVDSVVQRILRLKYRLYPNFDVNRVLAPLGGVPTGVNLGITTTLQIAGSAATLLVPAPEQFTADRPAPDDVFLIATDTRLIEDCASCPPRRTLQIDQLGQLISQLYDVPTTNITNTTFSGLKAYLNGSPDAPDLTADFAAATWVVLAMQDFDPRVAASDAVPALLNQRPDLLSGKRVIGLLFGPPQGLSPAELDRFTALYVVYGKTAPFVEVGARLLSSENVPPGKSPLSLPGLDYDLTFQTEPDPTQIIQLAVGDETPEDQPTPVPLRVGDTARLRTGIILDRNGHPVPDGTPVRFIFSYEGDATPTLQTSVTANGVARTEFVLGKQGTLLIRAVSEPALDSITIQITIDEAGAIVATLAPTPTPTVTPLPTATRRPTATPTITPTPTPTFWQTLVTEKPKYAAWGEWVLAVIGVLLIGAGAFWRTHARGDTDTARSLRVGLWSAVGGLVAYIFFSLGLPGAGLLRSVFGASAALLVAMAGGTVPLLWLWRDR